MPTVCPACGKCNLVSAECPRCGCDLASLAAVAYAANASLTAAAAELRAKRWDQALDAAERAWGLQHSRAAAQVAFLAVIGLGDATGSHRWYDRARDQAVAETLTG